MVLKKRSKPKITETSDRASPVLDLCLGVCKDTLTDPRAAETVYRNVLKAISRTKNEERYQEFERAWVLKTAYQQILSINKRLPKKVSAAEQLDLDSNSEVKIRLGHFDTYFNRLHIEERVLLVLLEKYKFPLSEIATIMGNSVDSLKLKRHQAMKNLREWIWEQQ